MIVLHSEDLQLESRIITLIGISDEVQVERDWKSFFIVSDEAAASIVVIHDLSSQSVKGRLFRFCLHPTLRPLILITDFGERNAAALTQLCVDEIVWAHRIGSDLRSAIQSCKSRDYVIALGEAIARNRTIPQELRTALTAACQSPRPISTQKELLGYARCHRSTLYRQWQGTEVSRHVDLKAVLDWIVLLRAAVIREQKESWVDVSSVLHVSLRTLSAIARRQIQSTLGQLTLSKLKEQFEQSPVSALFQPQGLEPQD